MHALSAEDVHEEGFARDSSAHWGRFAEGRSEHGRNDKSACICRAYWEQSAEQTPTGTLTNQFVMNTVHFCTALFLRKLHFKECSVCLNGCLVRFLLRRGSLGRWEHSKHTQEPWESESTLIQLSDRKWLNHVLSCSIFRTRELLNLNRGQSCSSTETPSMLEIYIYIFKKKGNKHWMWWTRSIGF